jgi:hypothetical protein
MQGYKIFSRSIKLLYVKRYLSGERISKLGEEINKSFDVSVEDKSNLGRYIRR